MDEVDLVITPQPGPQTAFLASPADIAIYGGAAGGGKSWGLLLEPLRHINNSQFGAVFFRRTTVQIRAEGGLWDESVKLYPSATGRPRESELWWKFQSGASITFGHLEHDKTVYDWQGSQIPLICFDELTHFSSSQFWYMLSRNRSMCGVKPYVRATCNPDVDSWVADLIAWWIDQNTGYPIPERAGVIRWFIRVGEELVWADDPSELSDYTNSLTGEPIPPKSLTFIPALLSDNKALMQADPGYVANLMALPKVQRERLLGGNWKIRWSDASFFPIECLLDDGRPVEMPGHCDAVFAVVDTAMKTGQQHDGTGVTYFARSRLSGHPLTILDWDYTQVEGAMLEQWLPTVFARLEELALRCRARMGSLGAHVEDKNSGEVLLQQMARAQLPAHKIDGALTALGKDERALNCSPYVMRGMIKIADEAYHKVVSFKGVARNHLTMQITNFKPADPLANKRADDLLDTFTYGISLALGNSEGF